MILIRIILTIFILLLILWKYLCPKIKRRISKKYKIEEIKKIFESFISIFILVLLWTKPIELQSTAFSLIKKPLDEYLNKIIFREENKLYQNNKVVAEVVGRVILKGDEIEFELIKDSQYLKQNIPLYYQGQKLEVLDASNSTTLDVTDGVMSNYIIHNFKCRRLE